MFSYAGSGDLALSYDTSEQGLSTFTLLKIYFVFFFSGISGSRAHFTLYAISIYEYFVICSHRLTLKM